MQTRILLTLGLAVAICTNAQDSKEAIRDRVNAEYPNLFELYKHLHANPELSFHEEKTSARVAEELKRAGFEVTTGVGKFGVVAVLKNGSGPTVLVRSDLDALPVKEQTGLPYASKVMTKDDAGKDVPVMHACGHDMHMTALVGTARVLAQFKNQWHGTLILIGQPAEERGGGAKAMLKDGLFTRFPKPDFCIALHDDSSLATGTIGYTSGFAMANVDSVDITVRGVGGHGAHPDRTKDPIVLASQIVLALQTIVSRELKPGVPGVVTVGSIHGGTKHNIISDEVKLQITVRSYADEVRAQLLNAIKRIARGHGIAAGLPEELLPIVDVEGEYTPATYNDPKLTERLAAVFRGLLGETNVIAVPPTMGGEDFSEYGRTGDKIPICMFDVGGVQQEAFAEAKRTGKSLPSLHSPFWAPDPEPTIKTGINAMTAAVLELMGK
ncbi:MAG: amidohydrolase [Pedosphaera sp.]|nr:amidohydrolase [Pedosphaera sp.]